MSGTHLVHLKVQDTRQLVKYLRREKLLKLFLGGLWLSFGCSVMHKIQWVPKNNNKVSSFKPIFWPLWKEFVENWMDEFVQKSYNGTGSFVIIILTFI